MFFYHGGEDFINHIFLSPDFAWYNGILCAKLYGFEVLLNLKEKMYLLGSSHYIK